MSEIFSEKVRMARKEHICSYCNGTIQKGEKYDNAVLKHEGELYEWKNHIDCGFIASALWRYIDPDEGMTEEDFKEGCRDFCNTFCCPDCPRCSIAPYNDLECKDNLGFCLDKIAEKLRTHDLKRVQKDCDWMQVWKCIPKGAVKDE